MWQSYKNILYINLFRFIKILQISLLGLFTIIEYKSINVIKIKSVHFRKKKKKLIFWTDISFDTAVVLLAILTLKAYICVISYLMSFHCLTRMPLFYKKKLYLFVHVYLSCLEYQCYFFQRNCLSSCHVDVLQKFTLEILIIYTLFCCRMKVTFVTCEEACLVQPFQF